MSLDFLLTNNAQTDILRPGNMTAGTERCGASQSRYQRTDGKDAGSFGTTLESARARQETSGPSSSDSHQVDSAAKAAGQACKKRPGSSDPEKSPEEGCTAQATQSSDAEDMTTGPTAPSTTINLSAVDVPTGMEPASEPVAEETDTQLVSSSFPSSRGDRSADGLAVDAAKTTPASPGEFDAKVAVAPCQGGDQPGVEKAETGRESKGIQGSDTEKIDSQASPAKAHATTTTASAPSAKMAIDASKADAAVKMETAQSERNGHQSRFEKDAGGSTVKSTAPSPSSPGHGDSYGAGRAGGLSSVFNTSQSGDGLSQEFGHRAGRDVDAYRSEPQASEKGAERPPWSTSALKAVAGGFQESTGVMDARSGTESEHKVADILLAPQRAVNGAGEAAAAAESGEAHHPKELRAEILGQVVDKAVLRLRNGQSEVRIDLKPDSLGHVKLQIVTENHQVTLRIMAESHAAKNLIDSGIGQLKTDLQAQGLRVDELEVSVANEFNEFNRHSAFSDDAAQARRLPLTGRETFQETVPTANLKPMITNHGTAGVDCFV